MDKLSWFVGIFEGEGSFKLAKIKNRRDSYSVGMVVKMTDEDTISRCLAAIGVGRKMGPYAGHSPNRPMWYWEVTKQSDILSVLEKIYTNLGERRKSRADDLINYIIRKNPEYVDFRA